MKHDHFVVQSPDKPAHQETAVQTSYLFPPLPPGYPRHRGKAVTTVAQVYPGFEQQNGGNR